MDITFLDMCKVIVKSGILRKQDGTPPTAEEIWNYSPNGELFMIFEWYAAAEKVLSDKASGNDSRT